MKKVQVRFIEVNDDIRNSTVAISTVYPKFEDERLLYLYELDYFDTVYKFVTEQREDYDRYDIDEMLYLPTFVKLDEDEYNEINLYLQEKTEYEQAKENDDFSLLQAIIHVYRNNPESWKVE